MSQVDGIKNDRVEATMLLKEWDSDNFNDEELFEWAAHHNSLNLMKILFAVCDNKRDSKMKACHKNLWSHHIIIYCHVIENVLER